MNNMLTQIDDEMLDQVSGGAEISVGPGAIGGVVDGVTSGIKGALDFGAGLVKGLAELLPTLTITWGRK